MPLAVVSVVQLFRFVALQVVAAALVPVNTTVALSPAGALPCCRATLCEAGTTARTIGTTGAVMRSVSNTMIGEPTAAGAVTVMVST